MAVMGSIISFIVGMVLYYLLLPDLGKTFQIGCISWEVALTDLSLSVTTQILAKLKLLYTDIGKTFMSSAVANEIILWVFLTVLLAIGSDLGTAPHALFGRIGFFVFCFFIIRPAIIWVTNRGQKNGRLDEQTICIILVMVLACGLMTDFLGTTSIVGAFAFGLVIPTGLLGPKFVKVVRGFVEELLMPIFDTLANYSSWALVVLVIVLSYSSKFLSSLVVSLFYRTPLKERIALGILMNTKGLLPIIILNFARDYMVIGDKEFVVLLIAILVMTMLTEPIISSLYKPKYFLPNGHRAIQKVIPGSKLSVVTCIHETQSVSGNISLLQASNPCIRSPLVVFALHLVQLTSHASALLLIHGSNNGQANRIHEAFDSFEKEHSFTSIEQQTVVSDYATMHVDICSIVVYKQASFILLPFHKRQTIHDNLENMSQDYKDVNDKVLANASFSVGILVDRGFGRFEESDSEYETVIQRIAVVYLGGPDEREALSYARKMAMHPNLALDVVRFVESKKVKADSSRLIDLIYHTSNLGESKKTMCYQAE